MNSLIKKLIVGLSFSLLAVIVIAQGSGTPNTLRVKTDANHALLISSNAQVDPVTSSTFNNTRLATDVDGNLLVTGAGGGGIATGVNAPDSNCTSPNIHGATATTGVVFNDAVFTICSGGVSRIAWDNGDAAVAFNRWVIGNDGSTFIGPANSNRTYLFQNYGGPGVQIQLLDVNGSGRTITFDTTQPTVTSGFGSSSAGTIATGSTSYSFRVTVGTNAGGTTGVIGLPAAANFWNCFVTDETTPLDITRQTASTVSSVTVTTTVAWTTADVLLFKCDQS